MKCLRSQIAPRTARRIMREQRRADLPGERGRVDDRAGARVRQEIPAGDLIAAKNSACVDVHVERPVVVGEIDRAASSRRPALAARNVERAQMRERSVERGPQSTSISHIEFERRRAAADRLRERQRRDEIEVGDRHGHAGGRQRPHDRRADASRASRDDRARPCKSNLPLMPFSPVGVQIFMAGVGFQAQVGAAAVGAVALRKSGSPPCGHAGDRVAGQHCKARQPASHKEAGEGTASRSSLPSATSSASAKAQGSAPPLPASLRGEVR